MGLNVVQVQANARGNPVGINDVKAQYAMQNNRVSKNHFEALQSSSQSPILLARRLDGRAEARSEGALFMFCTGAAGGG